MNSEQERLDNVISTKEYLSQFIKLGIFTTVIILLSYFIKVFQAGLVILLVFGTIYLMNITALLYKTSKLIGYFFVPLSGLIYLVTVLLFIQSLSPIHGNDFGSVIYLAYVIMLSFITLIVGLIMNYSS